jgi:CBS-domain-containing membrane protein
MERISDIPLCSVMVADPVTIAVNSPFSKVEELFHSHGIRHLPVVDSGKKLCGLITQTDLYRTVSPMRSMEGEFFYTRDLLDDYILKVIMTKEVATLGPEDKLASAVDIMVREKYGCIPIVDKKGRLEGMITQIDVLKIMFKYAGWVM